MPAIETFANACEIGPITGHLLDSPCPSDAPHADVATAIRALYRRPARVLERKASWEPVGEITLDGRFDVVPLEGDRLLVVTSRAAPVVHLWSGEPAHAGAALPVGPAPDVLGPDDVPGRVASWAVSSSGPALAVLHVEELGGLDMRRLVHVDADGVTPLGCLRRSEEVFAAGGSLWSAWRDGEVVRWGRWQLDGSSASAPPPSP